MQHVTGDLWIGKKGFWLQGKRVTKKRAKRYLRFEARHDVTGRPLTKREISALMGSGTSA